MRRSMQWTIAIVGLFIAAGLGGYVAGPLLRGQAPAQPIVLVAPKEPTSFREVAKKVLPAVVSIETKVKPKTEKQSKAPRRRPSIEGIEVPEEFRRFLEEMDQDGPERGPQQGFGSGVIVDPKGLILTNYHVVAGAEQVEVQLMDGRKVISRDVRTDPKTDVAIVRIDAKGVLPHLELGDSDALEIGDRVLAVGAPFGLKGSVSAGIISAKARNGLSMNMYEDFIQTDAAINPGNSGGPLVNLEGKVIGINSAIKTHSGGFQGVGLAVSSNLARSVMSQLEKDGTVKRGYLGIQIKDITDQELATRLGVKEQGVLVSQVFDKSPAARGGIQAGDVLTSIADKPVKDSRDLQRIVAGLPLGKAVDVAVVRDGKAQAVQVTIESQPEDFGTARVRVPRAPKREPNTIGLGKVGALVTDLTPETAEQLGYKEHDRGVVVTEVERNSLAEEAGLRRGMLIVKVDQQPVQSAAALKDGMDKGSLEKGVLLQVQSSPGGTGYILLKSAHD